MAKKMLHNQINSIVDLGGGLRLQPRGASKSCVEITDEQAASEAVQKMCKLRKIRLVSLDEHAQQKAASKKAAPRAPASKATPAPAAKPEPEKPKEEPKEKATAAPTPENAPEKLEEEPGEKTEAMPVPKNAPDTEDESTKGPKDRKKKSRKKG